MAYRSEQAVASHSLESSKAFQAVLAALVVATMGLWVAGQLISSPIRWLVLLSTFTPMAFFVAYGLSARAHFVAGPGAALQLYETHVVVPRAFGGEPLVFPMDEMVLRLELFQGEITFRPGSEIRLLRLSAGSIRRDLSSRLFASNAHFEQAVQDIRRLYLAR